MSKKKPKRLPMQRRDDRSQTSSANPIIGENLGPIAAVAWGGYQETGHGFALVGYTDDCDIIAQHIGQQDPRWEELVSTVPRIQPLVDAYIPEKEVVIVDIVGKPGQIRLEDELPLSPPAAYEIFKDQL